jgi:RHS repeat-associated protein
MLKYTVVVHGDGALLAARNETVAFERDGLGRVLTETQGPHTVRSAYDAQGERMGLTSSLGATVRYSRDVHGALAQIKAGDWQAQFTRDAQGLEIHRQLSGGVQARWKRDALGRLIEQRIRTGNTRVAERVRHYGWQENDRLGSIHDSVHGLTRFEHDAVGNLAATVFGDGTKELRLPDAVGNLFRTNDRQDRRYGPAGQLLEAQGTHYDYDAAGNLRKKTLRTGQEWHYAWSSAGHLAEVVRPEGGVVRFQYDALGRRVSKSHKGKVTRWVWDGNKPLHEWTELEVGTGQQAADEVLTWLFEDDSFAPLAKLQRQERHSILSDHLGTPVQMHDAHGQCVWAAELDSYGRVRRQEGEADCPFRYQGQYEDAETGLYYNRFRYYDPEAGQYVSQDPIRLKSGQDNLYAYVPDINLYIDPLGLDFTPEILTSGSVFRGVNPKQLLLSPSSRDIAHYVKTGKMPGISIFNDINIVSSLISSLNKKFKLGMSEALDIDVSKLGKNLTAVLDTEGGHVSIMPSGSYLKETNMSMLEALEDWGRHGENHSLSDGVKNAVKGNKCLLG